MRIFLPHDKEVLCRVIVSRRTTKKTLGKNTVCDAFFSWHKANTNFAVCLFMAHGKHKLCRAFFPLAQGKVFFPAGHYHVLLPLELDFSP
jgi:hypothetical protein